MRFCFQKIGVGIARDIKESRSCVFVETDFGDDASESTLTKDDSSELPEPLGGLIQGVCPSRLPNLIVQENLKAVMLIDTLFKTQGLE